MNILRAFLIFVLQLLFLHGIFSQYEIILEQFEVLLGDEDQFFENINMRVKRLNKSS
jgi:hypothetical protein